ncbi:type IX secretion system membrane protein PorP/SprF [Belliella kenyensis]|nr:type IX secretion system membrane protein PorP/SprF [Belliella kenyensis]MDN3602790.1 type IX secretion system membrane protein PorP/SprF [Belliella kenyensis]
MKKQALILFTISLICSSILKAQDFHYSQFYAAPLFLNPALTGSTELTRVGANYRKQWPGLGHDFNSYSAYFDHYSYDLRSGFGIAINSFRESNFNISTTDFSMFYAYNLRLSESMNFRMGTQLGLVRRNAALDNIIFGDQIDLFSRSINQNTIDNLPDFDPYTYLDISFGGLLTGNSFWLGVSTHHINRPSLSFYPSQDFGYLPMKWSVHGGYTLPLGSNGYWGSTYDNQVSLLVNYKNQAPFKQLDLGTQAIYKGVISGVSYRGIPGVRNMPNQDSIIFLLGLALDSGVKIGYSYDFMISNIGIQTRGAHEISIRHQFLMGNAKSRNQRSRILKCFDYMM